jgi:hypothetical protein
MWGHHMQAEKAEKTKAKLLDEEARMMKVGAGALAF